MNAYPKAAKFETAELGTVFRRLEMILVIDIRSNGSAIAEKYKTSIAIFSFKPYCIKKPVKLLHTASIPRFCIITIPTISFAKKLSEKLTFVCVQSSDAILRVRIAMLSFGQFLMQFAHKVQFLIPVFAGIVEK